MEKLLTIVIPAYNMEAYLDKCLASLIVGEPDCDLMRMLEVLVINDGSTDYSSAIAHGYEECFPETFKVIDKENGNYGSCINVALSVATGKYLKILDADDSFDNVAFVEYLTLLQNVDVDMVYSAFETVNIQGERYKIECLQVPSREVLCFKDFPSVYSKIRMYAIAYNRRVFYGLNYHQTEGIYYTDMEWIHLPMACVKTFVYFPDVLYRYLFGRPGQTMEPEARRKNHKMGVYGMMLYIDVYNTCLREGGKWNGIVVNMDYLHSRCIMRACSFYYNLLADKMKEKSLSDLYFLDESIRKEFPDFYKELDDIVLPNPYIPQLLLPFRIIRCWHKYGNRASNLQMWIVNHYLGLSARIAKAFDLSVK